MKYVIQYHSAQKIKKAKYASLDAAKKTAAKIFEQTGIIVSITIE
jgi:hypothetical protein